MISLDLVKSSEVRIAGDRSNSSTVNATSVILQIFMIFIALSGLAKSPLSPIFADHINQMVSCHVVFGK